MPRGKSPGYRAISEYYEHLIRSGRLQPGQTLLKEPLLAKQHGVTRTTLRKAFAILVDKGLVVKKRGQGTFVASASDVAERAQSQVAVISRESFVDVASGVTSGYTAYESVSCCYYQFLESVTTGLAAYGRTFRLYFTGEDPEAVRELATAMKTSGVIGIIGIGIASEDAVRTFVATGLPTVFVDSLETRANADFVSAGNRKGMKEATLHLLSTTPGPLAFIGSRHATTEGHPHLQRFDGFLDAHAELQRPTDDRYHFFVESVEPEQGRDITARVLAVSPRPTGIVCSDDGVAFGVISALRDAGVAIPAQMSVVGFANSVYCLMTIPTISSVSPDRYAMGRRAVDLLEKRLTNPQRKSVTVNASARLVLRHSTMPLPHPELEKPVIA